MGVYHSAKDVARKLKRDPHTVRDWIRFGCPTPKGKVKLPAAKFGKTWMVKDERLAFEHRVRSQSERPDLDLEEGEEPSAPRKVKKASK